MAAIAPSTAQIQAHVQRLRKNPKVNQALAVGIRSDTKWNGTESFSIEGQPFEIYWCNGPLDVRQRLAQHDGSGRGLVIVTPLDEHQVGNDVLARLARSRLETIRPWDILLEQFQARQLDPQVLTYPWMADVLLSLLPEGGFDAVPAGVLDLQTVWKVILTRFVWIRQHPVDIETLLCWTRDTSNLQKYGQLDDPVRQAMRGYLAEVCGSAAAAILDCVDAGHGSDAIALGLVCRVIYHESGEDQPTFEAGAVRLEKYTLDHPLNAPAARQWADAAEAVLRQIQRHEGINAARPILARADQLLVELKAQFLAHLSGILPSGFERRLIDYALGLSAWLADRSEKQLPDLAAAAKSVCGHDQACYQPDRTRRVEMSLRLARCLAAPGSSDALASFEQRAGRYVLEGGFVDWARSVLAGEGVAEVAEAFSKLAAQVGQRREEENERFAHSLVNWSTSDSQLKEILPIESVLGEVVAPLAQHGPVLMLVIDGMSYAVFRELLEDLVTRQGWVEVADERFGRGRPAVATIPSVTEFSRASLLCGKLTGGVQADAAAGFAAHPALVAVSRSGGFPQLFHKAELSEGSGHDLSTDLRKAIGSNRRVVGAVINAVDDFLLKGDQIQPRWNMEYIRVLRPLLHEAAVAGRTVILTSDHGHVIDRQGEFRAAIGGERWRESGGDLQPGEMLITGPRVMTGGGRIVALWSERVHYGLKKNGYHGGLAPQEMLAPVAVLVPSTGKRPLGWVEVGLGTPAWWDLQEVGERPAEFTAKPPTQQAPFGTHLFEKPVAPPIPPVEGPAWIAALLSSPVFASQKKLAGRSPISDAVLRSLLLAMASRGGTMLRSALARQLNLPPLRLPGVIAGARRLLNVDGVDVLAVDENSDSVILDLDRLNLQFDLGPSS